MIILKKELFLKILVAVLSGIIVILLIIIFTSNKCAPAKSTMHKITVNQHCIFNYTMDRFNKLSSIETADLVLFMMIILLPEYILTVKGLYLMLLLILSINLQYQMIYYL